MNEEIIVAFAVGLISGLLIMSIIAAASNIRWSCRDDDDLISRKSLVEYLNLDNYNDTDGIKVKYIRQFINKKEKNNGFTKDI